MKHFPPEKLKIEARRCTASVHNLTLQRADRMGMLFSLELRVLFFDVAMVDRAMRIAPGLKIYEHNGTRIESGFYGKPLRINGICQMRYFGVTKSNIPRAQGAKASAPRWQKKN
jgi:asparagine synthase (glutamine-hydrolysing)